SVALLTLCFSSFLIDSLVSRLAPRYPCGVTVYVAHPIRSILKSFSFSLFLIPNSYFLILRSHGERNPPQFLAKRLCLLGCEFDQRRPHLCPCRILCVDRNGLFQRSDHRRKFSATEHLTHDI